MGAEKEFAEENFVRATKRANDARVLARALAPQLQSIFPGLFTKTPHVEAITDQGWYNLTLVVGTQKKSLSIFCGSPALQSCPAERSLAACRILRKSGLSLSSYNILIL
jgi:hypothetical protein